jgi:TetR/AcrR family transcriptional regulator, transcriptional repressor for nem operon
MATAAEDRPRTARGAATRSRIVDAAAELMRGTGVASTSLDAVLEGSGTSKSQLYHYFTDKDALVRAVIRRQADHVLATQRTRLDGLKSIDGLRRWRDAVVASTRQDHGAGGCPLGSLVSELAEVPQSRQVLTESFARWQDELVDRFRAIRGPRPVPDAELADLASTLITSLQGGLLLAQATRSTRPLELALDAAIDHVARRLSAAERPTQRAPRRPRARR